MQFNLQYIAEHVIESTNVNEYIKKVKSKEKICETFVVTKENLINILIKSKNKTAKLYLDKVNDGSINEGIFNET
jgi:hypothetical protein